MYKTNSQKQNQHSYIISQFNDFKKTTSAFLNTILLLKVLILMKHQYGMNMTLLSLKEQQSKDKYTANYVCKYIDCIELNIV